MKTILRLENSINGDIFNNAMEELEEIIMNGGKINW
jgi:hypothetical protein